MSDRDLTTAVSTVFGHVDKGNVCRVCRRNVSDGRAKYCDDYCRNLARAVMGMLNWPAVRRRIVNRDDKTCQECGFDQDWLDKGHDHLHQMVRDRVPPEPETVPITEYPDLSDEELEEYHEKRDEWREACKAISQELLGYEWVPHGIRHTPDSRLEVDHIQPISQGGHPFDPANLRTLCVDCHAEKTAAEAADRAERRTPSRGDLSASLFEYVADGGGEPDA